MSAPANLRILKNFPLALEQYRQSGDICAFLNSTPQNDINMYAADKVQEFGEKFAAFEAAGFHFSSDSFLERLLELLVPCVLRQFIVARCSFEQQLSAVNSEKFQKDRAVMELGSSIVLPQLIVPSAVAILAVLFNISLLVVTTRKISMYIGSHWLLAFDSFCQILALLPFLVNLVALCVRLNSVDYRVCLTSLMLSTGSSYASFLAVYFMSLEQLLIVLFPMKMDQISQKTIKCLSLLSFLACTLFGMAMIRNIFNVTLPPFYLDNNSIFDSYVYCNTDFYALITFGISNTILGLALLNYVLIWACLIFRRRIFVPNTRTDSNNNAANSQETHRMRRSVFLIFIVLLIGWLAGSVLRDQIIQAISILTRNLLMCLFPMIAGINAPVLIINNSDYRKAYKKTLAPFLLCRKRNTRSGVVGPLFT